MQKTSPPLKGKALPGNITFWTNTTYRCPRVYDGSKLCGCCVRGGCQCPNPKIPAYVQCSHLELCPKSQSY